MLNKLPANNQDYLNLTRFGSVYHFLGFLAIYFVASAVQERPGQAALFGVSIFIFTMSRQWLYYMLSTRKQGSVFWSRLYDLSIMGSALMWGIFTLWVYVIDDNFSGLSAVTLLATAGIAAGAAFTMLINFRVMLICMMLLCGPSMFILPFLMNDPFGRIGVFFSVLFFIFLVFSGHRQNRVYWLAHDTNESLQKQAAELIDARNEALASNQAKTEFLAHMSHEIRTPLNGVIGMADLLSMTQTDENQTQYVHHIKESGTLLLGLINDILDFTRINSRALAIHSSPYALQPAMRELISMVAPLAAEKNLTLTMEYDSNIPPLLLGDRLRLQQVTTNLLGNAIKFTSNGSITLKLSLLESQQDFFPEIRCEVIDTGMGISEQDQQKIFEKFTQLENFSSNVRGTGLGLTISQKLIELMGGRIGVVSEPGKGSTFWYEVPAVSADSPELENT